MKNSIKYNKLVRDKIPEIIKKKGNIPLTKILSEKEYFIALKAKLTEEMDEFKESESLEELADILEVVFALASHSGSNQAELEKLRLEKQNERGGFEEKILLLETS